MKTIDRPLTDAEVLVYDTLRDVQMLRPSILSMATGLTHEAMYQALVGLEAQGLARVLRLDRSKQGQRHWQALP